MASGYLRHNRSVETRITLIMTNDRAEIRGIESCSFARQTTLGTFLSTRVCVVPCGKPPRRPDRPRRIVWFPHP